MLVSNDPLTSRDWQALREIALARAEAAWIEAGLAGRLIRLGMAFEDDGRLHPTRLGRHTLVKGSPSLWSDCA